jgi:hypothetical protein
MREAAQPEERAVSGVEPNLAYRLRLLQTEITRERRPVVLFIVGRPAFGVAVRS